MLGEFAITELPSWSWLRQQWGLEMEEEDYAEERYDSDVVDGGCVQDTL